MPQPVAGPHEPETYPAVCGYTHLFPGVRCRLQALPDPRAFATAPWQVGVDLQFSDGTAVDADLRTEGLPRPVLAVPEHTTGAGTRIDEHVWPVTEFLPAGDEAELRLGNR
ncbi:hypothetical protein [Streptomyces sp. NPDC058657]|uniref:hypothetical protein n=1 Tax=unclassified Streptomyces TaxID=2593676 RepID=UPI00365D9197